MVHNRALKQTKVETSSRRCKPTKSGAHMSDASVREEESHGRNYNYSFESPLPIRYATNASPPALDNREQQLPLCKDTWRRVDERESCIQLLATDTSLLIPDLKRHALGERQQ
jgi:hypothetical protein